MEDPGVDNQGEQAPPVTVQPVSMVVSKQPPILGCPPGLEVLVDMDQLFVRQEIHKFQTTWDKNRFKVFDKLGQLIFFVMEESSLAQRVYCGPARGFLYHFYDSSQKVVMYVRREFRCCTGCYACHCDTCRYFATVEDCNGEVLGHVSNMNFCCTPLFGIYDTQRNVMALVQGPFCPCQADCCTADVDYQVRDKVAGENLGKISKQWLGLLRETLSDLDNFKLTFPPQTNAKMKALMLGAVFIIDVMMYERKQK